jgi:hypothetical protein
MVEPKVPPDRLRIFAERLDHPEEVCVSLGGTLLARPADGLFLVVARLLAGKVVASSYSIL